MKAGEGGFPGLDGGIRIQIFEGERMRRGGDVGVVRAARGLVLRRRG